MKEESFSFWEQLPLCLQEFILSLLPVSTLIRCIAASRFFRSIVRSPSFLSFYRTHSHPLFLLSHFHFTIPALAYDPLLDSWTSLPVFFDSTTISASAGPVLLGTSPRGFFLYDPFSAHITIQIPNRAAFYYAISLISESLEQFKIVAVSTTDRRRVYSQVYDSTTGEWEAKGVLECGFALIANGVLLNGLLYCLGRRPKYLLAFDPVGGEWELVGVALPAVCCSHLLGFDGRLFLVGGVEDFGHIVDIGIWELDWVRMEWRIHCLMPLNFFVEFSKGGVDYFRVADRKGKICFCAAKGCCFAGKWILMYDLKVKRWWWPRACERLNAKYHYVVRAVEPAIELV